MGGCSWTGNITDKDDCDFNIVAKCGLANAVGSDVFFTPALKAKMVSEKIFNRHYRFDNDGNERPDRSLPALNIQILRMEYAAIGWWFAADMRTNVVNIINDIRRRLTSLGYTGIDFDLKLEDIKPQHGGKHDSNKPGRVNPGKVNLNTTNHFTCQPSLESDIPAVSLYMASVAPAIKLIPFRDVEYDIRLYYDKYGYPQIQETTIRTYKNGYAEEDRRSVSTAFRHVMYIIAKERNII